MVLALAQPQVLHAQKVIISPTSGQKGKTPQAARAAKASANVKTAIKFLQDWGWTNEAANIQKWFEDKKIYLDWDITDAETSTTSGDISLSGLHLLGGGKGDAALQHQFDPADAKDKERIVELAFTLVHEKVHAHQNFVEFVPGREPTETEAYNKEISDADSTLIKMDGELNKAINDKNEAREKEMLEWIQAVLEVKIAAIRTFGHNFPEARKLSWPDRILEDLEKLRKINEEKLKRFKVGRLNPDPANEEFRYVLNELRIFEQSVPAAARPMPSYWMNLRASKQGTAGEIKTAQGLHTVVFQILQKQLIISFPDDMAAGDTVSGTIGTDPEKQPAGIKNYGVEINGQKTNVEGQRFMFRVPDTAHKEGVTITLTDSSGTRVGSAIVPYKPSPPDTGRPVLTSPAQYKLPTIGQQGDPVEITGPFDGNYRNTECKIGGQPVQVIAESNSKVVIKSPAPVKGATTITLREGSIEKTGDYWNLGLNLNVLKTDLRKGERTTVTVQVDGLQGLRKDISLRLECTGMVNMKGGNRQFFTIRPQDVQANGTWTQKRKLTAYQKGSFQVTASISELLMNF